MKTKELLDQVKLRHGFTSDYQLAWILDVPTSQVSHYRHDRRRFDDTMALKVAALLELEPGLVLTWIHEERAERAGRPDVAKALGAFAKRAAAVLVAAIGVSSAPPPASAAPSSVQAVPPLCIMSTRRRRSLGFALQAFLSRLASVAL